jgi:uncharacterized protein YfcZ (UPF0381/DUF406 family)
MPDFSVTGIVTIDNTDSILSIDEVMDKAEKASQKLAMLRRKALSTISLTIQGYSILKQMVNQAGGIINPFFDMVFTMISSVVSTAIASAIMLLSSVHPVLVGLGIGLMILSTALSIKAQAEAAESKGLVEDFLRNMQRGLAQPRSYTSEFRGGFG